MGSNFYIGEHKYSAAKLTAGLYIIATPIGNLADISLRALETLSACDILACEDTRATKILLKKYKIEAKTISYNEHNSKGRNKQIIEYIKQGKAVGLVSDAGTPLINDPGLQLVQELKKLKLNIISVAGISSPIAALVASGLNVVPFRFLGFVANKKQAKQKQFNELKTATQTLIFFETKTRIKATLEVAIDIFGEQRQACIARELTKMFEQFYNGTLGELANEIGNKNLKGEMVLLIAGAGEKKPIDEEKLIGEIKQALTTASSSEVAKRLASEHKISRKKIYNMILKLK